MSKAAVPGTVDAFTREARSIEGAQHTAVGYGVTPDLISLSVGWGNGNHITDGGLNGAMAKPPAKLTSLSADWGNSNRADEGISGAMAKLHDPPRRAREP